MYLETFSHVFSIARDSPSGLCWKNPTSSQSKEGSVAGGDDGRGYWRVRCNDKRFKVHRVVALLAGIITEEEFNNPTCIIDHIDGNPSNNLVENLRKTSQRINCGNRKEHRGGSRIGATFERRTGRWFSRISLKGKTRYLGTFDTEEEAHERYKTECESLK